MNATALRIKYNQLQGRQAQIQHELTNASEKRITSKRDRVNHDIALAIAREVGLKTQQELEFQISEIVTLALAAIPFKEPYSMGVEFVERRGKIECDLTFVRDGYEMDPLDSTGGGACDIAAFALRVASWSMQRPRTRAVLLLDEPFKNLSADLMPYAGEMMKEMSEKLNLQIIMVTHEEGLKEAADKMFDVSIKNRVSTVKEV